MGSEYLYVGLALLLVLANGFFVATEFAIVKIRPTKLRALVEAGKPGAANALKLVDRLDGYLSATQFGITLASLGLGALGEPAFARLIEGFIFQVYGEVTPSLAHSIAFVASFALITFLHIVLGELAPKSLAIQRSEATALAVAWPMRVFYFIFFPGIWLLNGMAGLVLKLFGLTQASEMSEAHSEEELKVILASSAESGGITGARAELLERALAMVSKTARQVMVPRNQIRYLDLSEPLERIVADARTSGHTWLPVCRENLDQIEGVVNVKDLFFLLSRGELRSLAQVQRPVLFVPENVTLEQLLSEFRRRKRQMAMVVDEHGGTSGMVSLADVVAELVGDVAELGRKNGEVKTLPGGRLELQGSTQLDDLQQRLGVEFEVDPTEVTTVGGFVMATLGRVPVPGDKVPVDEFDVQVLEMDGPRVMLVRIQPREALKRTTGETPAQAASPAPESPPGGPPSSN